jgi:HSP20 family protein
VSEYDHGQANQEKTQDQFSFVHRREPITRKAPGHLPPRMFQPISGESKNMQAANPCKVLWTSLLYSVDIYETENELVVKADLPDVNPQDLDIRVENNILTIRGERKFEKKVNEDNYLRIERAYGSFSRSFALANSVKSESIKADYHNGVLTLSLPKREEAKPKQIKVNVGTHVMAAAAGAR